MGGDNHTYIYSLRDGSWEESITLDEIYNDIKISGRTLLATKYNNTSFTSEVYSYNIQDCTQDMPTQSPSPSSPPTISSLPTTTFECFGANDGGQDGVLYKAVRSYVDQDCANNEECDIAQAYGWPMNSWCLGNVKSMYELFKSMDTFNEDINGWNTSSVTSMRYMFSNAEAFNRDLSKFDTSSVTDMRDMFSGATSFNRDVSSFDTSSVFDMAWMFAGATAFNRDISNFDTSSVSRMNGMFRGASLFNGDVSNFDTSRVADMRFMFEGASSFDQDLCSWRDSFPYNLAPLIFEDSGCTYQDTPQEDQKGPFCASDCQ